MSLHPEPETMPVTVKQAWQGLSEECGLPMAGMALEIAKMIRPGDCNGGGKYSQRINGTQNYFGLCRLSWDRPIFTVITRSAASMLHPDRHESLTMGQLRRLGGYPDGFMLTGNISKRWECIGNSVPPLFMRAIALRVRAGILPLRRRAKAA